MDHLAGAPVTLLIKAPNQRLGDQVVQCFLDWSVQKLKSHLAAVYPSKPSEKNQRIIYSGKLLKDNLLLKDVLRLDDKMLQQHTVHLVCSPSPDELLKSFKSSPNSPVTSDSSPPTPAARGSPGEASGSASPESPHRRQSVPAEPTVPENSGLRHRTVSTPSFSNYYPYSYGNYPMQNYGPRANQQGYMAANHQQQAIWMQQMYAQQMAQYMQYSNQIAAVGAGLNANLPPAHAAPVPVVVPPPQVADQAGGVINPPVVAPNVAPNPDQNVRMNAGLGPAVDDEDEDNANRDWLDWVYTLCRFGVMLSLVYFYSSLSRFLMVVGFMIFIYMYQKRWFQLRRAPIARERLEENRNSDEADGVQEDSPGSNPEQQQQDGNADRESSSETQEDRETDSESAEDAATPEPPRPGVLAIAWVFLSTFFTSLFPQDPNVVAGN